MSNVSIVASVNGGHYNLIDASLKRECRDGAAA